MIPLSVQKLKIYIEEKDRNKLLNEIHFMSPHLVFFGIDDFSNLLKREKETERLSFDAMKSQVLEGMMIIEKALEEIRDMIDNQSNGTIV